MYDKVLVYRTNTNIGSGTGTGVKFDIKKYPRSPFRVFPVWYQYGTSTGTVTILELGCKASNTKEKQS